MTILILLASIILPILMVITAKKWDKAEFIFHVVAVISTIIFGNIAAVSVYEILHDKTVFMTNIHGIFLNPFFLMTSSYLGLYLIYQLLKLTMRK